MLTGERHSPGEDGIDSQARPLPLFGSGGTEDANLRCRRAGPYQDKTRSGERSIGILQSPIYGGPRRLPTPMTEHPSIDGHCDARGHEVLAVLPLWPNSTRAEMGANR